jgi:hypothetical protein
MCAYVCDANYNNIKDIIKKEVDKTNGNGTIGIYSLSQPITDFSIFKNINKLCFVDYYFLLHNLPEDLIELHLFFHKKYEHKICNLPPKLRFLSIDYDKNIFDILLEELPPDLQILQVTSMIGFLYDFDNLPNNLRLFMCGKCNN